METEYEGRFESGERGGGFDGAVQHSSPETNEA